MAPIRRLGSAAAALALLTGTVLATPGPAGAKPNAPSLVELGPLPTWLSYDRPAQYPVTSAEIRVPMRDGVQMRCTKLGPAGPGGQPLDGRHPVVVTDFFAYRMLQYAMTDLPEPLAERGYVTLSCSPRGSGGTPGAWQPFAKQESQDNYDLIEWAAAQPWSTGKVGQVGISYGGISTYKAVSTHAPHLAAAVPIVAFSNAYREIVYPGGAPGTVLRWWPAVTGVTAQADQPGAAATTLPDYAAMNGQWKDHPTEDDYWKPWNVDGKAVGSSKVPILGVGGWGDLFPDGMVRNYLAAKQHSHLLMLPGAHLNFVPGDPDWSVVAHAMLGWFDRYLMKLPNVPQPRARITSWELPHYSGRWTEFPDWPTRTTRLILKGVWGPDATSAFIHPVNPFDNGCFCMEHGAYNSADLPMNDQRLPDSQRVMFDEAPVDHDTVIVGTPVAHLRATLSAPDGNIVVRLEDVGPDRTSYVITTGWLRASHRLGHEHPLLLTPNQPYDFTVPLWPTDWNIRAGHFLRITVSSGDVQMIEPFGDSNDTMILYADLHGSTIDVPFRD
ncbi:MAG TPA: CocE/NonD family hydrolase [Sporichthyaceae bacterium]|nr:CocE/NonD family hydrolase [Sporichthyaceae bacterium]